MLSDAEMEVVAAVFLEAVVSVVFEVLVEGARSAEPPVKECTCSTMAFITRPEASRVANGLSEPLNISSRPLSQP